MSSLVKPSSFGVERSRKLSVYSMHDLLNYRQQHLR